MVLVSAAVRNLSKLPCIYDINELEQFSWENAVGNVNCFRLIV